MTAPVLTVEQARAALRKLLSDARKRGVAPSAIRANDILDDLEAAARAEGHAAGRAEGVGDCLGAVQAVINDSGPDGDNAPGDLICLRIIGAMNEVANDDQ